MMGKDPAKGDLTCHEFHHFSKLPAELRLKIWNLVLPPARIVPIRCGSDMLSRGGPPAAGCTSTAPVPALLHACTESRAEAMRRYGLMFGVARQPGRVFFAPDLDVLYFGPREGYMASAGQLRSVLSLADPTDLARVHRVALSDALFWVGVDDDDGDGENGENGENTARLAAADRPGYLSAVAASLTSDALNLVRCRLPAARELVFVPSRETPAAGQKRLARQIQAALDCVREGAPEWVPPRWKIMTLEPPFTRLG